MLKFMVKKVRPTNFRKSSSMKNGYGIKLKRVIKDEVLRFKLWKSSKRIALINDDKLYRKAKRIHIATRIKEIKDMAVEGISLLAFSFSSISIGYVGVKSLIYGRDINVMPYILISESIVALSKLMDEIIENNVEKNYRKYGYPIRVEAEIIKRIEKEVKEIYEKVGLIKDETDSNINICIRESEWEGLFDIVMDKPNTTAVRFPISLGYMSGKPIAILLTVQGEKSKGNKVWDKGLPKLGITIISEAFDSLGYEFFMLHPNYNVWVVKEKKRRNGILLPEIIYYKYFKHDETYTVFPKYSLHIFSGDGIKEYRYKSYIPIFPLITSISYDQMIIGKIGRFKRKKH